MSDRTLTRRDAYRTLCLARFREFYREFEVVFWSFLFPVMLSVGLAIAFRNRPVDVLPVVVQQGPGAEEVAAALRQSTGALKVEVAAEEEAAAALRMGKAAVVVVPAADGVVYRLDPTRPESAVARARVDDLLQRARGRKDALSARNEEVHEPGSRYIDFLVPGILGMNIMSGGIWGVGFNLVDMRIRNLLKRLVATPMRRSDFMLAQMTVRLLSVFAEVGFLLAFSVVAFGLPLRGSLLGVLVIGALGAVTFGGIGVLLGSRANTIEKVSGLMNLVMMPMFIFSGIFFSTERFPAALQPFIAALPLTALNDAFRAVILEGASLASQWARLAILGGWGGASFFVGLRVFRWN